VDRRAKDKGKTILRNVVIFTILKISRLFKKADNG
jgi:hypothetical protein